MEKLPKKLAQMDTPFFLMKRKKSVPPPPVTEKYEPNYQMASYK